MDQNERRIRLIRFLIAESPEYSDLVIPEDESGAKRLLRGLMNLRPPLPAPDEFLRIQDAYLAEELRKKHDDGLVRRGLED